MRNDLIRDAIHHLDTAPDTVRRTALYRQLSQGFLLVAVADVPDETGMNGTPLQEEMPLTVLTTTMPDGGTGLLAFTDQESLQAHATDTLHVAMQSRDVLEVVVDQGYDALIINAAGPWAGIPREDVLRILAGVWS